MKRTNFLFTAAFVVWSGTAALAQPEARPVSLEEAVSRSLQASHQLAASRARIQQAAASLREAREQRLPDLSVQGSFLRLTQPTVNLKVPLGGSGSQQGSTSGGSGSETSGTTKTTTVDQVAYGLVNLSLPIYAGGRGRYAIEAAKYLEQAARLDAENDRSAVAENTIAAYSTLYKATAALALVRENLRSAEQRTADFSSLEKNGLLARNDLLKVQLQQSNINLSLLDAESDVRVSTVALNLLMGLPEETPLQVDSVGFQALPPAGSLTDWEAQALGARRDAQALDLRRQASQTAIKMARAEYLPSLAVTGGYVAADIRNFLTITNALNAGVGIRYSPSSLWKNGTKVSEARARLVEVEANQAALSDAIRQQVYSAYQAYILALRKIEVYDDAVAQAAEAYRIVKNKNENALATTTELLDADVAQLQARLSRAYAQADAAVAYARLQRTAGSLANEAR